MWKKCQNHIVKSKRKIKRFSRISLLLLALLLGFQQMNMISAYSSLHVNAQGSLLAIGTDSIFEGDEVILFVNRTTEGAETIKIMLPDDIAIDIDKTEESFSDTTEFTFDEENNSVGVSYGEETLDQSVELYLVGKVAGSYRISARSTNEVSSDLDLTVHEATTEEQATSGEQVGVEEEQATSGEQVGVEEEQMTSDGQIDIEETTAAEEAEEDTSQVDSQTQKTTRTDENEVSVSTWEEFRSALTDQTVTKIDLENDITRGTSATLINDVAHQITRSLEINGNGYKLSLGDQFIYLGRPTDTTDHLIHIHDATLENSYESFVDSYADYSVTSRWRYKFGNITVERGTTNRVARATRAGITVYGTNNIDTRSENFYTGSIAFEPDTVYFGNVNYSNYSVIWYNVRPLVGDTGEVNVFDIGEGATVRLSNDTNGTAYPAVFEYYGDMIIRENAKFYASMAGNAVRFDRTVGTAGSTFIAKSGAVVNLTSRSTSGYATVSFASPNSTFTVESRASVYIVGATNVPVVDLTTGYTGNQFILNNPKQYDIRNRGTGYAINLGNGNSMSITNSDIDLWNMGTDILGTSSVSYSQVEYLTAAEAPASQAVTSSVDELLTDFRTNKYRRIAGMNTAPEVIFSEITDADLSIAARVKIGTTPDDAGSDEYGNINFIDVFSARNQSKVSLSSSNNSISYTDLGTDENGYVTYSFSDFLKAGTILSASAVRGAWIGEDSTIVVQDVTPPEPAVLDGDVKRGQTTMKGKDGEPGATVTYTINGADATDDEGTVISTIINEDGTWEIAVPSLGVKAGDELQIFLTDTEGNKEPSVDTDYHDATFKAATIITVIDGQLAFDEVPDNISFGTIPISSTDEMYSVVTMDNSLSVIDTRAVKSTWTVTAVLMDELYNAAYDSTLPLVYVKDGNETPLSVAETPIYTYTSSNDEAYSISDIWYGESEDGLYVQANSGQARVGEYTGTVKWTLADVPANEE